MFRKFRRSLHHLVGLGHLGLPWGQVLERSLWRLLLDGLAGGGSARAGPLPLPFPSVGPGGRPLVSPGGVGSVPTDGKRECWPSLVQGK